MAKRERNPPGGIIFLQYLERQKDISLQYFKVPPIGKTNRQEELERNPFFSTFIFYPTRHILSNSLILFKTYSFSLVGGMAVGPTVDLQWILLGLKYCRSHSHAYSQGTANLTAVIQQTCHEHPVLVQLMNSNGPLP